MFQKIKRQSMNSISIFGFRLVVLFLVTFSLNTFADTNAVKEEMRLANKKLENLKQIKTSKNRFIDNSNPHTSKVDLPSRSTSEKWDHLLPSTNTPQNSTLPATASKSTQVTQ